MPDSMSISSILLAAGWNRRKVAILNLLFSLTTPQGALLAFLFFRSLAPEHIAFAIGISAETFLPSPRPISSRKSIAWNNGIRQRWFSCWPD
jgi:zinc transporter ZupT